MKKTSLLLALMTAGLCSSVQAAAPTAFNVQQLVNLNKLHSAAVSNDGTKLVYGVKIKDANNEASSDLYLLDLSDKNAKPMQLTSAAGTESDVTFAPDGKSIYFMASRSGSSQIYKLALNGGEAIQVTDLPLDVNGYKLSQDGKQVVMTLRVFPECKDLQCSKDKFQAEKDKKTTGREYKQLMVRHWDTWEDHARNHLFVAPLNGNKITTAINVTQGRDTETPPKPFSGMEEVTFTPDGQHIVYSAKAPSTDQAWTTNYDLWQVSVKGGETTNLTPSNAAWDAQPVFSADGRYLAYLAMSKPGFEADRYKIMLRDNATGDEREVAPLWDRSPSSINFSSDGRTLYVTAQDVGQVSIFEVNTQFGDVRPIYNQGSSHLVAVTSKGIIFDNTSLTEPGDLYKINLEGEHLTRLTEVNKDKLANIKFGEYQQFNFKGWNDETVHGYWIKPTNFEEGKQYPIAYLVHGGPQGSFGNSFSGRWNAQLWAGAGYGVVMVDFHGSTGYGQAFTDSISKDWGGKPLEDLQKGLAAVAEQQPWLDATNACALGGSYGGYMMNWIQGHWNTGFKCLVNHAGLFDMRSMYHVTEELWFPEYDFGGPYSDNKALYEKFNPVNYVENWKTPMLIIHGEKDFRVPYGQGLAAFSYMQRKGIPSELLMFPDENHWILNQDNLQQWYNNVLGWMDRWTAK
ncbi:peptidase S9, prolyl oligopeptidase active site region [Shewanella denitrificans OS217]|jgi:dipeptidyl aminopeptidase/acylaminoacyl peptidase|uniref:Peptidase S9, prolyl oligopeptidase active site region n=1 Tax=Shewanella denitrificans (strain OS217 / ATCC BAA-1090 / DSM 15013) TaxID=318161 RepID=Q12MY2_SHEDO|nr:S9 family peptidase [Shewanella denitrificans]ABE55194.1 peptidase S9, prolyl oligopeptidase active site region [Shewanella denitrificans OS217]